jgi:hypothetical protein
MLKMKLRNLRRNSKGMKINAMQFLRVRIQIDFFRM